MKITPLILLLLASVISLNAAEVELLNGQVMTGTILEQTDAKVVLQIQLYEGEGKVTIDPKNIQEIRKVSSKDATDEASPVTAFGFMGNNNPTYDRLVIHGAVGDTVFAEGLKRALLSARQHGIGHIVFEIDSNISSGATGDLDEVRKIAKILKKNRNALTYHVVAKECRGSCLIFALYAHSIHMHAGGSLGGRLPQAELSDENATMRADLANRVSAIADDYGRSGIIFGAMIDPSLSVSLWLDDNNKVQTSPNKPSGMSDDKHIVSVGESNILVLTDAHFKQAGLATISNESDLLAAINVTGMTRVEKIESRYESGNKSARKNLDRKERSTQRKIESYLDRIETSSQVLTHSIEMAKLNDPSKGDYSTVGGSWNGSTWNAPRRSNGYRGASRPAYRGRGRSNNGGGYVESKQFTSDSRKSWRRRSDATLHYLNDAIRSAKSLLSLNKQAKKVGIESDYTDMDLKKIIDSLQTNLKIVKDDRNRRGK